MFYQWSPAPVPIEVIKYQWGLPYGMDDAGPIGSMFQKASAGGDRMPMATPERLASSVLLGMNTIPFSAYHKKGKVGFQEMQKMDPDGYH